MTTVRTLSTAAFVAATLAAPPATAAVPVIARADMTIVAVSATSSRICVSGHTDTPPTMAGAWQFTVNGARSNGTTITYAPPPVLGPILPSTCYVVSTGGAPTGFVVGNVTYLAVGGDVTAGCVLLAEWTTAATPPRPVIVTCTDSAYV